MGNNIELHESKQRAQLEVVQFVYNSYCYSLYLQSRDTDANQERNKLMPNNPHNLKINKSRNWNTNIPKM